MIHTQLFYLMFKCDSSHGIYDISNTIYIDNLTNAKTK